MRRDFERIAIGCLSILTGVLVGYISIIGPLFLSVVTYKSSASGVLQFTGQDLLNLIFVCPVLITGGGLLIFRKPSGVTVLAFLPLYLIYYGLSYAIGVEWGNPLLVGNSEQYIYCYIFLVISGLLILMYCIENLEPRGMSFKRRSLVIYSVLASVMTLLFAMFYIQAIQLNLSTPTEEYLSAPALFWFVKTFDLSFLVPLMGISIYMLWTRPLKSFLMQILNFGFFITMTSAVNMMALVMFCKGDPTYSFSVHLVFITLELISILGFVFILRSSEDGYVKTWKLGNMIKLK